MISTATRIFGALATALLCIFAASGEASAQEKLKLRLVMTTSLSSPMLPYLVSKDQGWYDQNGLDVQEIFMTTGDANAVRAVVSGSGDIAMLGLSTILHGAAGGASIRAVGAWQPIVDYQIVAGKNVGTKLEDLAGKIFASAGPSDLTTEIPKMVLKKHNIDISGIKFLQIGGHPERLQAVEAGKVQASMISTLTAKKGVMDNMVNIITAVKDEYPTLGFSFLMTSQDNLADPQKRKAFEILVKGGIVGARYVMDNPDGAAQLLNKRIPDMPLELIKTVIPELNAMKVWGYNGGLDKSVVQFTSDLSVQLGMLERAVKADDVVDTSLVDKAIAELGKR